MWRISLRELLVLVAVVAFAIVSLKYASFLFQALVSLVVFIVFTGSIIAAVMDRGERQAFALGMILTMAMYAGLLLYAGTNYEFAPQSGSLPTSIFLNRLYELVKTVVAGVAGASNESHPYSPTFMRVGHCWWALLLGYIGGRFAQFIYVRRAAEAEK